MANFNQNPLGQAAVNAGISDFDVTIEATTVNVKGGASLSGVQGTSGSLSLAQVKPADFNIYPAYRRQIRLIEGTPTS